MRKCLATFSRIFECGAVQKCVNPVDLVKSFQTSIYLQNLALIQPTTKESAGRNKDYFLCPLSRGNCTYSLELKPHIVVFYLFFKAFGSVYLSKYPMVIGTKTAGLPPKTCCTVPHFVRLVFLRFLFLFFQFDSAGRQLPLSDSHSSSFRTTRSRERTEVRCTQVLRPPGISVR